MAKVRVSTLAKEFGMTSKELMGHLAEMKIPAKSASSALEDAYVAMVRKQLASVIEARATDIAEFVQQEIKDSGYAGKLAYGIVLTGGGSLLYGFDKLIAERTQIACSIADDADSCVANGCGKSLQWIGSMQEGTINLARRKLMKEQ